MSEIRTLIVVGHPDDADAMQRGLDRKYFRVISPGAMLAGSQFDRIFVMPITPISHERYHEWFETALRTKLTPDGVLLVVRT